MSPDCSLTTLLLRSRDLSSEPPNPALPYSGSLVREMNEHSSQMQIQVRIPTLPPMAPGLLEQRAHDPPPLAEWALGSVGFLPAARPRDLVFPFSPWSIFFFFIPSSLASFSSRLRNPGQTAAFSNPSRPPGAQRASPLPRPAPRPERRPGPGRPHAVVPDLNLRASVGEGCCRPQPIGGAGQLGPSWALPRLAGGGRCPPE